MILDLILLHGSCWHEAAESMSTQKIATGDRADITPAAQFDYLEDRRRARPRSPRKAGLDARTRLLLDALVLQSRTSAAASSISPSPLGLGVHNHTIVDRNEHASLKGTKLILGVRQVGATKAEPLLIRPIQDRDTECFICTRPLASRVRALTLIGYVTGGVLLRCFGWPLS